MRPLGLARVAMLVVATTAAAQPAPHDPAGPAAVSEPGAPPVADLSLYQLDAPWTDQAGRSFRLGELSGHPTFVLLFFGSCEHVCPALVEDLRRLDALLAPAVREDVRFVLVSFDPERDTVPRLAAFAREQKLDAKRWSLLNGSSPQVRELAAVLGVRYRPSGDGSFSHTLRITLLDAHGVIVDRRDGIGGPLAPLARRASELEE